MYPRIDKFGWETTPYGVWILFFHYFPLISLSIFHSHPLKIKLLTTTETVWLSDSSINVVYSENITFLPSFPHCIHIFCADFSTLTAYFEAEFSTPHPSFQPILGPWYFVPVCLIVLSRSVRSRAVFNSPLLHCSPCPSADPILSVDLASITGHYSCVSGDAVRTPPPPPPASGPPGLDGDVTDMTL